MSTVLIVGAGVTGLLTAVECALAGHRVTVLDRGPIPNPASTSFDQHRAFRVLRPGDAATTRSLGTARRRWVELEALLDTRFFRRVGIVTAWPVDDLGSLEIVEPEKLPHVVFPPNTVGVLDTEAGVLLADRFLRAATGWLATHPLVTLQPMNTVVDVHNGLVALDDGDAISADLVLVAAGPWSRNLVAAPVTLHRQTMVYLRTPENLVSWWENAPGVGRLGPGGRAWLIPPGDGTLLKISTDAVCREVEATDSADDGPWSEQVLAEGILSDMDSYDVVAVKECHYTTETDTGGALLTQVEPGLWSRPACGGNGFSTAPLIARQIVMEATA